MLLSSKQMNSSPSPTQPARMTLECCDRVCSGASNPLPAVPFVRKPKSPRTAYDLFVEDKEREIQGMLSASTISRLNVSALIADWWRNITPSQRNRYTELAEQDKLRYSQEMSEYRTRFDTQMSQRQKGISSMAAPLAFTSTTPSRQPSSVVLPSRHQTFSTQDPVLELASKLDSDSLEFLLRALAQN
eukprot:scaffold2671_cov167-Amphora_coffeaeformis.AAC.6